MFVAIVVALLSFSASGASALLVDEPCIGVEQSGQNDGSCPPTCVTCGCCVQAAELLLVRVAIPEETVAAADIPIPHVPKTPVQDILHVPKPRVS